MKYLIGIIVLLSSFCCMERQPGKSSGKHAGLYIQSGQRQGFQYFDSTGKEFNYRYVTVTVYNDSTVPVQIKMETLKEHYHPCYTDSQTFSVFLLPRHLTPKQQQFDNYMSKELKQFLDTNGKGQTSLTETIAPGQTCVMTFGVLTRVGITDPMELALLTKDQTFPFEAHDGLAKQAITIQDSIPLSLGLDFKQYTLNGSKSCFLVVPCGQLTFQGK